MQRTGEGGGGGLFKSRKMEMAELSADGRMYKGKL
jgi:hypothetical protein